MFSNQPERTFRAMYGFAEVAVRFRLHEVIEASGLSQSEVARRSGLSFVTINAISNNRTKQVSLATLDAICEVMGIEPGELFERDKKRRGR